MNMEEVFRQCRFSKRYYGYRALQECLQIVMEDEDRLLCVTGIYMEAARRCQTSQQRVERNIRTMLEESWRNGGRETLEKMAGGKLYARPSVGEALEMLSCYLKEQAGEEGRKE